MKEKVYELFNELSENGFERIVISNPPHINADYIRIVAEPKLLKDTIVYQFACHGKNFVHHENIAPSETSAMLSDFFERGYKQFDIYTLTDNIKILSNKQTSKIIKNKAKTKPVSVEHNRQKNYIINEGEAVSWLVELGVTDQNGKVLVDYRKKFKQFNRFLEFLSDIEEHIPENAEIIDFGCGKAYLTFAAYHYFNIIKNKNVSITGLDLKLDVVERCGQLAEKLGYDKLRFICKDIADYRHEKPVDMVITLHACDIATDLALASAIRWGAKVILCVPCCQHELNPQLKNELLKPVLKHGILRERLAAILTDAIRAEILELCGYKTSVMEFIDLEHTPKNIMIRAIKSKTTKTDDSDLERLISEFGVTQTLHEIYKKEDLTSS